MTGTLKDFNSKHQCSICSKEYICGLCGINVSSCLAIDTKKWPYTCYECAPGPEKYLHTVIKARRKLSFKNYHKYKPRVSTKNPRGQVIL